MKKILAALAAITVLAGLWAALATASSSAPTRIEATTVAVAPANELHPGTRLVLPTTYHRQHVARFQWLRCNLRGFACRRIAHATHRVYVVRLADVGHTLRARVTTWQGSTTAVTAPSPQVGRPLPVNTAIPAITDGGQGGGTIAGPIVGDILTGSNGTWQHAVRFTYQWMDCNASGASCVAIVGATTQTYILQDSDVGDTIVFQVTAYNF